ncbi:MAG: SpoIID/LytB domain protein [Candidatus Peregrinibacteria bacterium GW2011_GWA2_47_7]|nr:MAG: SpoIID/LytB domain protein [Candidatus Peregrinibacteria bacterium GW2011_GWA2_47_7]
MYIFCAFAVFFIGTGKAYAQDTATAAERSFPYKDTFVISGYYSPEAGQARYVTGTYEGDLRLNGNGIVGGSGKPVYPGMLAAPPEITFGTKIEIPGIGILAVYDRGGAIKNKRLDVWMGRGEIGMRRALAWGLKTVEGTVYGIDETIQESVDLDSLPLAKDVGLLVKTRYFKANLGYGDKNGDVEELQRLLSKTGFYNGEITGTYDEATRSAVLDFQLDKNIISDDSENGAGYFGPKTRSFFEAFIEEKKQSIAGIVPFETLKPGDSGGSVAELQQSLALIGFSSSPSAVYDASTAQAIIEIQKKAGLIEKESDFGAGYFGPQTREALKKVIADAYTPSIENLIVSNPSTTLSPPKPPAAFTDTLKKGDRGQEVRKLQEELRRLNFLRIAPTDYFGEVTEHAVFKFQQSQNIVKNSDDPGAGYVGPHTRERLSLMVRQRGDTSHAIAEATKTAQYIAKQKEDDKKNLQTNESLVAVLGEDLRYGQRHDDVRALQKMLKTLGYYEGNLLSDYFGDITRDSLIAFQMTYGLINSKNDANAGIFDARTRETIEKIVQS